MQVGVESVNVTLRDLWALVLVLPDPVEMLHIVGPSQELHKILVVGDNKELEVALTRTTLDYPTKKPKVDVLVTQQKKNGCFSSCKKTEFADWLDIYF